MSRSRKKTPIERHAGDSQKESKQQCNRIFRRVSKINIGMDSDPLFNKNEELDEYSMSGDGKRYVKDVCERHMRK
jgi:hypothetical protein